MESPRCLPTRLPRLCAQVAALLLSGVALLKAEEVASKAAPTEAQEAFAQCEDKIAARVQLNTKLSTPFFSKKDLKYPWWIIQHDDGHLENTSGEALTAEDRKKIELTSNCYSTHQGDRHRMEICEAELDGAELNLSIYGGMPAFFGTLDIKIHGDEFQCAFDVNYPSPEGKSSQFRITKKQLNAQKLHYKIGKRYLAWLSVEFQEATKLKDGTLQWQPKTYKVEGYVKPIITKAEK